MKDILIISNEQFGYHTDSFKYSQILKSDYNITYLCFDKGQERVEISGVQVVYISWEGSKIKRSYSFIITALSYIYRCKGVTFIVYFNGFYILHFLAPWKKAILDIRTLSVSRNKTKRIVEDFILKITAKTFSCITVISEGVRDKLGLSSSSKTHILPLGADPISEVDKDFNSLRLLYVGTLNGRNILETLKGYRLFYQQYSETINLSYDIVGDGEEKDAIQEYIAKYNLEHIVRYHGYIHHSKLNSLFDQCNVGVAYVPLTTYFEYQPVTKVFEYTFSGLYTIATATQANMAVISSKNGILIKDTPEDFVNGMKQLVDLLPGLDSKQIKASLSEYRWDNIVNDYLRPLLDSYDN